MNDAHKRALRFPTMLRKMWSGGEVQEWINDHIAPLFESKNALDQKAAQDSFESWWESEGSSLGLNFEDSARVWHACARKIADQQSEGITRAGGDMPGKPQ